MAYSQFVQPFYGATTRFRLPAPSTASPFYSSGLTQNQEQVRRGPTVPQTPPPAPPPAPPRLPEPRLPQPQIPKWPVIEVPNTTPTTPSKPKLEASPYLETIYKSIQNMDPELRSEYLQTTAATIKDRLDRYEFRIARGIPLTPEQQNQYNSIRNAYNDIQKYINNSSEYDAFFAGAYKQTSGQLNSALALQNYGR
jgi:hypothetical protein